MLSVLKSTFTRVLKVNDNTYTLTVRKNNSGRALSLHGFEVSITNLGDNLAYHPDLRDTFDVIYYHGKLESCAFIDGNVELNIKILSQVRNIPQIECITWSFPMARKKIINGHWFDKGCAVILSLPNHQRRVLDYIQAAMY